MHSLSKTTIVACALPPHDTADWSSALSNVQLPHLNQWLQHAVLAEQQQWHASSLSPPHEHMLAQALGWPDADGLLPWAAQAAQQRDPQTTAGQAWAWIHLCHWHVRNGQVMLMNAGPVSVEESDALLSAMLGYFLEDGIVLHAWQPGVWLAQAEVFRQLPTAAWDRVLGRHLEPWLVGATDAQHSPEVKLVRRLQNEMQMLLYQHPVNATRSMPLNSFWVSGSGALPPTTLSPPPLVLDALTAPALAGDVAAWVQAWQALDAEHLSQRLAAPDAQLVLCGDTHARSWQASPPTWGSRLKRWMAPVQLSSVLSCN
jgi:hypothetical protein